MLFSFPYYFRKVINFFAYIDWISFSHPYYRILKLVLFYKKSSHNNRHCISKDAGNILVIKGYSLIAFFIKNILIFSSWM